VATTRDKLLLCLKENRGNWISGEWLSQQLAVSRAAINKHVGHLRKLGYCIDTSTKKGYSLGDSGDLVLPDEIREGLDNSVFGAKDIVYLAETDSTNTRAKDLAARGAPEGTIVIAEKQTQGRGRKGRGWFSPESGGIYLSLILRPAMTPSEAARITLMTGVAAAEALLSLTKLEARIKWPNDILLNGKKIAGILTEVSTEMDKVDHVVVGVGMNVNITAADLATEIKDTATSILIETGEPLPRVRLIRTFLKSFEGYYRIIQDKGFEPIRQRWKELSDIIGRWVQVEMIGRTLTGRVADIDLDGLLVVIDEYGANHRIISGDVTLLMPSPEPYP
jgi:BirA family transcriptional regulator, biotin operon repressor / biotin---[acetyl-CoA-carboxylase] ligase